MSYDQSANLIFGPKIGSIVNFYNPEGSVQKHTLIREIKMNQLSYIEYYKKSMKLNINDSSLVLLKPDSLLNPNETIEKNLDMFGGFLKTDSRIFNAFSA